MAFNIYSLASQIIPQDSFGYLKFAGSTTNDIGIDVASYDPEVTLSGSIQAVERKLVQELGLDWKRNYIMVYTQIDIMGVDRDYSGDIILFDNKRFQGLSEEDWIATSDWTGVLFVEVENDGG